MHSLQSEVTPDTIDEMVLQNPDKVLELLSNSVTHDEFWKLFQEWTDLETRNLET